MRNLRLSSLCSILVLSALSTFGQSSSQWRTATDISEGARGGMVGTVADVDDARNRLLLDPDDDRSARVTVTADALTTQFNGFGGVINGQPEIFTGSSGFVNLRVGDRIDVRGTGRQNATIAADTITLLGRSVPASPTGVGQTRPSGAVSTPSVSSAATTARVGTIDGTVQQVNAADSSIVIVTDRREVLNVRTSNATPVYYHNDRYRVENLEIGDRIRVTPDSSPAAAGEVRAASIEVVRSVQDSANTPRVNSISGRVSRIDRTLDMVTVDNGRQSIRVDVASANDPSTRRVRAADFIVGDHVDITGHYSGTATDLFIADVVRFADDNTNTPAPSPSSPPPGNVTATGGAELGAVTIYGTVRETLSTSPQLVVRDNQGRTIRINVLDDFLVRGRTAGTYTTAEKLKENDSVVIKAFRDADGNYIAQTIRLR
jgi:Domain of unknown function (DUF5666)